MKMPPAKKAAYAETFDPFAVFEGVKDGFSKKALEEFREFIIEGRFRDAEGNRIEPDRFFWLDDLYSITRTQVFNNDFDAGLAIYKAAQTGATTTVFLFMVWCCIGSPQLSCGFFFPAKDTLQKLVRTKFDPLIASSRKMQHYLKTPKRVDNVLVKQFGSGYIHFIYFEGEGAIDSVSLNILCFDEVRLLDPGKVDQAQARNAQQAVRMTLYTSTAGMPGDKMENLFELSTRTEFHSRCADCTCMTSAFDGDEHPAPGKILALSRDVKHFVRSREDGLPGYEYYCNTSDLPLEPWNGDFYTHNPNATIKGIHYPAILSKAWTADRLMEKFNTMQNIKTFWNDYMGQAHLDPVGAMIKSADIENMKRLGDSYPGGALIWHKHSLGRTIYGGADVRNEEIHAVFGNRDSISWIEVFQGPNFISDFEERLETLNVVDCATDREPLTPIMDALARRNRRVTLVDFYSGGDMLKWRRPREDFSLREEARSEQRLLINKTQGFKHALRQLVDGKIAMPSDQIMQQGFFLKRKTRKEPYYEYDIGHEFGLHLQNIVYDKRVPTKTLEDGSVVPVVGAQTEEFVQGEFDPHFSLAFLYWRMMLEAVGEVAVTVHAQRMPSERKPIGYNPYRPTVTPKERVCGMCERMTSFSDSNDSIVKGLGLCRMMGIQVSAIDPACTRALGFKPRTQLGLK